MLLGFARVLLQEEHCTNWCEPLGHVVQQLLEIKRSALDCGCAELCSQSDWATQRGVKRVTRGIDDLPSLQRLLSGALSALATDLHPSKCINCIEQWHKTSSAMLCCASLATQWFAGSMSAYLLQNLPRFWPTDTRAT